ncbi:MAG: GTPase ObgE, partial [Polyangiaceae bacterium]
LGHPFLRHIERTKVLVHVIDVSSFSERDPVEDFETVRRELVLFEPALAARPQLVAPNKIDALDDPSRLDRLTAHAREQGLEAFPISAATGEGVSELLNKLRGESS